MKVMMILTTMMTMPAAEPFDWSCPAVRLVQRRPFRWAAFVGQPSVQIKLTNQFNLLKDTWDDEQNWTKQI